MRSGVIGPWLVAVSVLVLVVGCGESEGAGTTTAVEVQTTIASPEAQWIETFESTLATMRRDIRSFIRTGRPAESLVHSVAQDGRMVPQYFCGRRLGQGGPPPTRQLADARRSGREACDHLQRALEASQTFRATTVPGGYAGGDREGAAAAAREAKAPLARAEALLEASS
jgi:hypothetical protein